MFYTLFIYHKKYVTFSSHIAGWMQDAVSWMGGLRLFYIYKRSQLILCCQEIMQVSTFLFIIIKDIYNVWYIYYLLLPSYYLCQSILHKACNITYSYLYPY